MLFQAVGYFALTLLFPLQCLVQVDHFLVHGSQARADKNHLNHGDKNKH